jgi:hypothetical protein
MRSSPPRGEVNGQSKVTAEDVRMIRALRKGGWTLTAIGEAFGISYEAVRLMSNGTTWAHIPLED